MTAADLVDALLPLLDGPVVGSDPVTIRTDSDGRLLDVESVAWTTGRLVITAGPAHRTEEGAS